MSPLPLAQVAVGADEHFQEGWAVRFHGGAWVAFGEVLRKGRCSSQMLFQIACLWRRQTADFQWVRDGSRFLSEGEPAYGYTWLTTPTLVLKVHCSLDDAVEGPSEENGSERSPLRGEMCCLCVH